VGFPAAPPGISGISIGQQPASQTVADGQPYTFTVQANNPNGLPVSYQWKKGGDDISGATGPSYSGTGAAADDGAKFSVVVKSIGTALTSVDAMLTIGVVGPPLAIARSGPGVVVSWPAPSTGFNLEQSPTLQGWTAVTTSPTVVNGRNTVTISPATGTKFYRLHQP